MSATYLEAAAASCPRSACRRQRVWPSGLDARLARCSRSHWKHQGNAYMRVARVTVRNKSSLNQRVCGTRNVFHRSKMVGLRLFLISTYETIRPTTKKIKKSSHSPVTWWVGTISTAEKHQHSDDHALLHWTQTRLIPEYRSV